jgi:hypothetical protein
MSGAFFCLQELLGNARLWSGAHEPGGSVFHLGSDKKAPSLAGPGREQVQGASNALLGGRSKGRGVIVPVNRGGIPPGSRTKDVASIRTRAEASSGAGLTA